jgi:hypothetical protein
MRRLSFQVETESRAENRPLRNLDAERAQYRPVVMQIDTTFSNYERSTFGLRTDGRAPTGARFH